MVARPLRLRCSRNMELRLTSGLPWDTIRLEKGQQKSMPETPKLLPSEYWKACSMPYGRDTSCQIRLRQSNVPNEPVAEMGTTLVTDLPLPVPSGIGSPESNECGWSLAGSSNEIPQLDQQVAEEIDTTTFFSDESESSSGSDAESCATDVIEEQASSQSLSVFGGETKYYQHRKSKVVHVASLMGTSFSCGRQLTPEYRQCSEMMVVASLRCQQCRKHATKVGANDLADLDAVVKRARRQ